MKTKQLPAVTVTAEVPVEDLIEQLRDNLTREEYIEFIKRMELRCEDLDVTYELRDHFDAEIKKEEATILQASKSLQNA